MNAAASGRPRLNTLKSTGKIKGSEQPYLPGKRARIKVRSHTTAEGLIGGGHRVDDGSGHAPAGRYDAAGQLRLIARTLDRAPPVPDLLAGQGVAPAA